MNPDFSKAPAGATHWGPETEGFHAAWFRQQGSAWFYWTLSCPNHHSVTLGWVALGCQFHRADLIARQNFREILREQESGNGFTLTTDDARSAFAMAEKMAFSGNDYSIKLSGVKGGEWVVVVTEVGK